jgi:hypothetical protein
MLHAGFGVISTSCAQSVRYDKTILVGNGHTWYPGRGPGVRAAAAGCPPLALAYPEASELAGGGHDGGI